MKVVLGRGLTEKGWVRVDEIINIFAKLGADKTIFYQFVIFLIFFVLLKPLLFDKLLEVLISREDKTVNLQDLSNEKLATAERMATEYNEKLVMAQNEIFGEIKQKKTEIIGAENKKIDLFKSDLKSKTDKEREDFKKVLGKKRESLLGETEKLSEDLVEKLI